MSVASDIVLPERWRPWQRRKNTVIYYLLIGLIGFGRRLPLWLLRPLGMTLAGFGYIFAVRERRRAIAQVRQAMPEIRSPAWLIWRSFLHFGRAAADCVRIEQTTDPAGPALDFSDDTAAILRHAIDQKRGVLFVSPHLGNWEVLVQACARRGMVGNTIAKESYDPRLTKVMEDFRGQWGVRCLWRSNKMVVRQLIAVLRRGDLLGALIDQDTKVPSVWVPFFGRPAKTAILPAYLACRNDARVVFGYAVRVGGRYKIEMVDVPYQHSGDDDADALALTAELTRLSEVAIRRYPEQWVWMHDRWKSRPTEENAGSDGMTPSNSPFYRQKSLILFATCQKSCQPVAACLQQG